MRFIHLFKKNHISKLLRIFGASALACCLIAAGNFSAFAAETSEDASPSQTPKQVVVKKTSSESEKDTSKKVVVVRSGSQVIRPADQTDVSALIAPLVEADEYRDQLKVSWTDLNDISEITGYAVEVRTSTGKLKEEKCLSKYENSYRTDFEPEEGITYTFYVKVLGDENHSDSKFGAAQYNTDASRVYRPRGLELKVEDKFLQASWDAEEDADSYRFLLLDPNGELLADKTGTASYYYLEDIPVTEKGQYTMYVQTIQDGRVSPFSKYYRTIESRFEQIKAPEITKTEFIDRNTLEVSWEEVEHAKSYTLRLRTFGSNQSYLSKDITTTDIQYTFEKMEFRKDRKYVVEIRANAEKDYASSDFEGTATNYYGW